MAYAKLMGGEKGMDPFAVAEMWRLCS